MRKRGEKNSKRKETKHSGLAFVRRRDNDATPISLLSAARRREICEAPMTRPQQLLLPILSLVVVAITVLLLLVVYRSIYLPYSTSTNTSTMSLQTVYNSVMKMVAPVYQRVVAKELNKMG